MTDIDLGFAEECDGRWLANTHFPSKIGGKPAWLHLGNLPSAEALKCSKCGSQKSFLCQIYAPFDDEYNFHRTIYIFVCRTANCTAINDSSSMTVLRSQLPLKNHYYSTEPPPEEGDPLPAIAPPTAKLCAACGCLGHLTCSRCKSVNYCGASHQKLHWKHHKLQCSTNDSSKATTNEVLEEIIFPEWEIVMNADDDRSEEENACTQVDEKEQLEKLQEIIASGKAGDFQDMPDAELEKYAADSKTADDKHFRLFRKECGKEPKQIVRYKRQGQPLWIANTELTVKNALSMIPACELCGEQRQYEFQIMPQMLNYLKDTVVDWGILAIYTCPKSCPLPTDIGYTKEYIIKQDIMSEQS